MPATVAPGEIHGPDLAGVVADANAAGLPHVVIGGFAVIAHGYFRATKDSDLLVPDGPETDQAILRFFERIGATRFSDGKALTAGDVAGAHHLRVDSRHGVIDIMRGGRGQDRVDLEKLEGANGELPVDPIPGLDT